MKNEDQTKDIAQQVIDQNMSVDQFAVSQTPFHTHNGSDSPFVTFDVIKGKTRFILYRVLAPSTSGSVLSTVGGDLVMPFDGFITSVGATVDTAGTTGTTTFDINKNGTTILGTIKISIDSAEKTSRTAASQTTVLATNFKVGDIFTFDIDTVQTTPALGLTFFINATQT